MRAHFSASALRLAFPAAAFSSTSLALSRAGCLAPRCTVTVVTVARDVYDVIAASNARRPIHNCAFQVSNRTQHVARSMGPRFYGVKSTSWHDDKDEEDAADSIAGISAARRSTAISTNPAAWPPTTAIMIHTLKDMTNSMQM